MGLLIMGSISGCCTAALLQGGKHDKSTFQLCMAWIMGVISSYFAVTTFVLAIDRNWNERTSFDEFVSGAASTFLIITAIAFAIYLRRKGVLYLSLICFPYMLYSWMF